MDRIPFKPSFRDGDESVMVVGDINPDQIRFNRKSREITICCDDTYKREDIDELSWQKIKELVEGNGGTWQGKESGIKYLIGRDKS